jgi:hypothetical protein
MRGSLNLPPAPYPVSVCIKKAVEHINGHINSGMANVREVVNSHSIHILDHSPTSWRGLNLCRVRYVVLYKYNPLACCFDAGAESSAAGAVAWRLLGCC